MERFRHLLVTTAGQIRLACKESSNPDLADCVQEHPILALHSGCQCCVQGMCEFRRCLNPDLKTQTLFCPFCPMSVLPTPPDHPNPHQSTAYTMAPSHSRCYESTGPGPSGRTSSSLTGIKDRSRGRHPSPCHHRPVQRSLTRRGQVDATKLPKNQSGTSDGRPQFSHHQDSSPNHRPSLHCRGRLRREHRSRDRVGPSQHVQTSSACSGQYMPGSRPLSKGDLTIVVSLLLKRSHWTQTWTQTWTWTWIHLPVGPFALMWRTMSLVSPS